MDLDQTIADHERRIRDLEGIGPAAPATDPAVPHHHRKALEHLDAGDLDAAGKELKLERSHDGEEPDESFGRRLKAEVHGAVAAEATEPRQDSGEAIVKVPAPGDLTPEQKAAAEQKAADAAAKQPQD